MEIQLQELIEQIRKDGVEAAETEAQSIINAAQAEAEKIVADKLSVRAAERLVKETLEGRKSRPRTKEKADPYLNDLAERLTEAVGAKVKITSRGKDAGKIEIEYYSSEDLDRIYELIRHSGLTS